MMAYQGYLAHITFDEQANLFHGEVINIRDVATVSGAISRRTPPGIGEILLRTICRFVPSVGSARRSPSPGGLLSGCRRSSIARSFWRPRRLAKTWPNGLQRRLSRP